MRMDREGHKWRHWSFDISKTRIAVDSTNTSVSARELTSRDYDDLGCCGRVLRGVMTGAGEYAVGEA